MLSALVVLWLGACSDATKPSASLNVGGIWDWTATIVDPSTSTTCSDTGSYVFDQIDSTFTGIARQVGVCRNDAQGGTGEDPRVDTVGDGRVGEDSLGFSVHSCRYSATATGAPNQLSGPVSCGGVVTGTWQAHRPRLLGSVTLLAAAPPTVVPGVTLPVRAVLRDTAGNRVFFRPLTWTSDNPAVATVIGTTDSAEVTATGPGTATISATVEGHSGGAVLTVTAPGAVRVTTSTAGVDLDADGYTANVDGGFTAIPVNGAVTIAPVLPGTRSVFLFGVADNCTVAEPNPSVVSVPAADTANVAFTITCTAAGSVRVTTASSGTDVPGTYVVSIDYLSSQSIGADADVVFEPLGARSHIVFLDTPTNCAVSPTNPVTVDVTSGNTTNVAFQVACAAIGRIAFNTGTQFGVAVADGSAFSPFPVAGFQPAWSPDGARLAFTPLGNDCAGVPSGSVVCVMNADGTGVMGLPISMGFRQDGLSWSPNGSRIAFVASGNLCTVKVDGSGDTVLTSGVVVEGFPSWSPDGSKIAFGCAVESGNSDVCVVNADGSGLVRLTADPAYDGRPAWKPDGTRIAFSTTRYGLDESRNSTLAVMNPDGSGVTAIGRGDAPAWSPDGGRIAFLYWTSERDPHGAPYSYLSLGVMRVAGPGGNRLGYASSVVDTPAWQP